MREREKNVLFLINAQVLEYVLSFVLSYLAILSSIKM